MENPSLCCQLEALKLLHEMYTNGNKTENTSEGSQRRRNESLGQKPRTVAERARESQFSRLVEILSQVISIEQDLMAPLSENLKSFLFRHKDSVDLKNICLRMAVNEAGVQSDRNLKELRGCLQLIVDTLLSAVRDENSISSVGAFRRLVGISTTFPDM